MAGSDKLTEVTIKNAKPKAKPYKLADGGGLYLEITASGAKYWRLKYRYAGKEKRLALGVYPEVPLKEARLRKQDARKLLAAGDDPSNQRRQEKLARRAGSESEFKAVALEWAQKQEAHWSPSYIKRVGWILDRNLFPWLGHRPIGEVTAQELLAALKRTESKGILETAHRTKNIAGQVIRYAVATGRAERDISQDLRGALKTPKKKHIASITEPSEVAKLLIAMDGYSGTVVTKSALLLSPLLFCRPGELRQLEWDEVNLDERRIEIPLSKMKTREQAHIIPLSNQATAILEELKPITGRGRYIFPSARGGSRPLSDNGVRTALRTLGYGNDQISPHGFRAMARTILDEILHYPVDWIEHQLAHAVRDPNGRAYNRTAHLDGRRKMMQGWADYLDQLKAVACANNIIPLQRTMTQ
jgi:integrase